MPRETVVKDKWLFFFFKHFHEKLLKANSKNGQKGCDKRNPEISQHLSYSGFLTY